MAGLDRIISRYREPANPLMSERRLELVAVVLTTIMLLLLALSFVRFLLPGRPAAILPAADSLTVMELPSAGMVSPHLSNLVRVRPVFWPSRRAVQNVESLAVADSEVGKASPSELDQVELRGIFGSGDSVGVIALVKGKKKRVMLGDKVVGWKLDSIDGDSVNFVGKGKSKSLSLARGTATVNK